MRDPDALISSIGEWAKDASLPTETG